MFEILGKLMKSKQGYIITNDNFNGFRRYE